MQSIERILAAAALHWRLLVRTPAQIASSLGLAVISIIVFGLLFKSGGSIALGIAGHAAPTATAGVTWTTGKLGSLLTRLRADQLGGVLVATRSGLQAYVNPADPTQAAIATAVMIQLAAALGGHAVQLGLHEVAHGTQSNNVGWLLPGLLGSLLMWANFFVGQHLAQWREFGLLKRLGTTCMRPFEFLLGQALGQLAFSLAEAAVFLAIGRYFFGVVLPDNLALLAGLIVLGSICLMSLGYLLGGLSAHAQAVNSIALLVAFPMMFLGGTYFSVSQSAGAIGAIVRAIPLSHLNDALRGLIDYGGTTYTWGLKTDLLVIAAWTVLSALAASRLWRFSARA